MTTTATTGRGTTSATTGTTTLASGFPMLGGDATYTVPTDRVAATVAALASLGFTTRTVATA